jgi:hypothetical protein
MRLELSKAAYTLISTLVVTASSYGAFYWGSRPILNYLGISEFATGLSLFALIVISYCVP